MSNSKKFIGIDIYFILYLKLHFAHMYAPMYILFLNLVGTLDYDAASLNSYYYST